MLNNLFLERIIELADHFGMVSFNVFGNERPISMYSDCEGKINDKLDLLLPIASDVLLISPSKDARNCLKSLGFDFGREAALTIDAFILNSCHKKLTSHPKRGDLIVIVSENDFLSVAETFVGDLFDPYIYSNIRMYLKNKTKSIFSGELNNQASKDVCILFSSDDLSAISVFLTKSIRREMARTLVDGALKSQKYIQYSNITFENVERTKNLLKPF